MKSKAYHSGDKEADNSQTPWWIINQIQDVANVKICHDVCARDNSKKAETYWGVEHNALEQDWVGKYNWNCIGELNKYGLPAFWMNPPFSLASKFTEKAADEALQGCVTIGCVKHAPDADWFQKMEERATFIYVPDGRIQFLDHNGEPFTRWCSKSEKHVKSGANFPLCFPLWTPFNNGGEAKQIRFKRDKERYEKNTG